MKENNNLSLSDLSDSTILRENESLLSLLLKDHTTGKNIKWGTNSYINHGYSFQDDQEIKIDLITGWYEGFIRPRVDKDIDIQPERQRTAFRYNKSGGFNVPYGGISYNKTNFDKNLSYFSSKKLINHFSKTTFGNRDFYDFMNKYEPEKMILFLLIHLMTVNLAHTQRMNL